MSDPDESKKNNGFIPNSFQTPNILVDRLMPLLLDNELRVTLYAYRHIFGWPDNRLERAIALSLTDFERGYRGQPGCGLSRPRISAALKSVARFGALHKVGEPTRDGQCWRPPASEDEIDWLALEARTAKRQKKAQHQIANASQASKAKRDTTSTLDVPRDGTLNVPFRSTLDVPPISTLNVLSIGTLDVPPTYIKTRSSKDHYKQTESSTETQEGGEISISPLPQDAAAAVVDDDAFLESVNQEISGLGLTPERRDELLARGPIYALATVWHIKAAKNVANPAGLAVHLMQNGGPPDEMLERASFAVELKTLDAQTIDREINKMSLTVLVDQANELAAHALERPAAQADDDPDPTTVPLPEQWQALVTEHSTDLESLDARVAAVEQDDTACWVTIEIAPGMHGSDDSRTLYRRLRGENRPELFRFREADRVPADV